MSRHAWLTPDLSNFSEPEDCRVIKVPGSLWYLVSGCLELLAETLNWEQFGTATEEETAQYFREVTDEYTMSSCAYIGEVRMFLSTTLPDKWLPFDGSQYSAATYPELFAALPSVLKNFPFFTLPDLSGHVFVGDGTLQGEVYSQGYQGGSQFTTLTVSQLPSHTHQYYQPVAPVPMPAGLEAALPTVQNIVLQQTAPTGNGDDIDNRMPHLTCKYGIYAGR